MVSNKSKKFQREVYLQDLMEANIGWDYVNKRLKIRNDMLKNSVLELERIFYGIKRNEC